ncbi:MAG TPA: CIA30 family protein [Pyrinomonadaceae bacterium]|nr:CIA30 family protein [Pyrinomonadaceae bacterium]
MKKQIMCLAALAGILSIAATAPAQSVGKIVDFKANATATGQHPGTYTDKSMKGTSTIVMKRIEGSTGQGLQVSGAITNDYPYGFAGLEFPLAVGPTDVTDVSQFTGVRFHARGDGQFFFVLVTKEVKDYDFFGYSFKSGAEWNEYVVPFSKFKQLGFGAPLKWSGKDLRAVRFQIQTFGPPIPSFRLDVDRIEFY